MNKLSIHLKEVNFAYGGTSGGFDTPATEPQTSQPDAHTVTALHEVSLTCTPGTITLICGASGSGKSTILRLINGLIPHFNTGHLDGTITVQGDSIPDAPLAELGKHSETVFQNPRTQFFTSEVMSELAFRGENWGLDPATIIADAKAAAERVGITDLLDRRLDALSGGQLQKVACAQALTPGTEILLFDEPTSNLSPEAIDSFAQLLATLKAQGHTIVVAEHRLYCLRGLVDQVIVMADGRITHQLNGEAFFNQTNTERLSLGLRTLTDPRAKTGPPRPTPDPDQGLTLHQVQFGYGQEPVLKIEDITFAAGKITAITGDNGVGKSTLARVISGLAKPNNGGRITLNGQLLGATKRLASTALVMQDVHRQLFAESVLAEVMLGRDGEQDETIASQILNDLGLGDTLDRHPLALSGGQKQRLVVASAVVARKSVYILDEPTSGVDYRHLHGISTQMRRLADTGAVVLVITHDPELIATCADEVAVMRDLSAVTATQPQIELFLQHTQPPL